jgi:hypothetical protein
MTAAPRWVARAGIGAGFAVLLLWAFRGGESTCDDFVPPGRSYCTDVTYWVPAAVGTASIIVLYSALIAVAILSPKRVDVLTPLCVAGGIVFVSCGLIGSGYVPMLAARWVAP